MVASLLRLLHSGLQNTRLTPPRGQPALSFFQKVFIKAGRFTTQWVRLEFDQTPDFGKSVTLTLPRQGHLITRLYLVATFPDIAAPQLAARAAATQTFLGPTFGWTNSFGHALVQTAQLDIAGARADVLDFRLLEVLDEFNTPLEKVPLVNKLIGRYDNGFSATKTALEAPARVAVPLPFWFCQGDSTTALPIDAIGADAVTLNITFAPLNDVYVCPPADRSLPVTLADGKRNPALLGSRFYQGTAAVPKLIPGISMPTSLSLGNTYVMAEYVYLDKAEANRFRMADLQYPVTQHYALPPHETIGFSQVSIPLRVPNPTRTLFFYAQRPEAPTYNAPFLATRDLSGADCRSAPWWPDASGLENARVFSGDYVPAFTTRESDPIRDIALLYEGRLVRYGASASALFRSILPAAQQRKTPWVNKYYYALSFDGGGDVPTEANLDKIRRISLELSFTAARGANLTSSVPPYVVYMWAETFNILRVYGGRAALMFAY